MMMMMMQAKRKEAELSLYCITDQDWLQNHEQQLHKERKKKLVFFQEIDFW